MNNAAKQLSAAAKNLSTADRLELVETLLDSLDAPDPAIDRQWAKEAEDRLAAYRRGEIKAASLESVVAKYKPA
ncbi:MAG: addiction module protein [Rhodospirillaceae bacterium]|nr:addiction module protein [Rhodospirillaceae bacterium]